MGDMRSLLLAMACAAPLWGCAKSDPAPAPAPALPPAPPSKVHLLHAPDGPDAAVLIAEAQARSVTEHRRLLVYVGATWCEPCRYFHDAAAKGELDAAFGMLDLLEFDADHDRERLAAAGYQSDLIPLLAVPGPQGRSTGRQMEGSIKGPGAVANMTPRLRALLAEEPGALSP